ncbi:MAG: T9SS type A sorting domain-containing protein, partial [Bacteroidetes bacterium]|nr:T9SS type A sorting domain-containing protein [Bacteroidota bacterium]
DQHVFLFPSGEPDAMISANDGGLFRTSDCTADSVIWQRLNNGYVTSQFYTIYINEQGTDDIIIGGFQDNGNFFTNSADPASEWTMPLNGDGSFGHICNNGEYYIMSIQQGRVFKLQLDADGNALAFARIDPIGPAKDDYDFINPLAVDPNNNDILYIPCYRAVYRNNMLSQIPLNNNIDSISTGWFKFTYEPSYYVSAIAVSTVPADRVYYGCSGRVYRIDSAGTSDPATHPMYVMPTSNPGNISCIAVDPRDADKVMVVMSNYLRYSLFYTEDGFTTIYKVAGNMEQYATGAGNGPSLRWATIMPVGDSTLYLLGTSVGLFATGSLRLDADSTIWTDVGHGIIGNVVVEMIKTRETDNMVVVATHGNGCYSMKLNSIDELFNNISNTGMAGIKDELNLYPNPAKDHLNIDFSLKKASGIEISLFDGSGRIVKKQSCGQLIKGIHHERINLEGCGNGVFFIIVNSNNGRMSGKFLVE